MTWTEIRQASKDKEMAKDIWKDGKQLEKYYKKDQGKISAKSITEQRKSHVEMKAHI